MRFRTVFRCTHTRKYVYIYCYNYRCGKSGFLVLFGFIIIFPVAAWRGPPGKLRGFRTKNNKKKKHDFERCHAQSDRNEWKLSIVVSE